MVTGSQPSRSDQASIKYQRLPLRVAFFDHSIVGQQEDASRFSGCHKECIKECEYKPSDILSTAELVSAVGHLWDYANQSLSVLQPKDVRHNGTVNQKENILCFSDEKKTEYTSAERGYVYVDLNCDPDSPLSVDSNFEYTSEAQRMTLFASCIRRDRHSRFRRYKQLDVSSAHVDLCTMNSLSSMQLPSDLGSKFGWISRNPLLWLRYTQNSSQNESKGHGEISISVKNRIPVNNVGNETNVSDTSVSASKDSPLCKTTELHENVGVTFSTLSSEYLLRPIVNMEATAAASRIRTSILRSNYFIDSSVLDSAAIEQREQTPEDANIPESSKKQLKELHLEDKFPSELCSLSRDNPNHSLPKQRYAFAGALAGTFVSVCLHPIDTIKTVIQSRSTGQKPIFDVVGSIISERGVTGLYRGIASNITSSAPISAVYTFTYESVKGALLPLLPKEYYSIAHCTAGGCASIATSFIFTPSERIKQQMQVSTQYQNCWTALVGILKKGGFSSLYAGWGAVLCRNVPHSIIKFYTYETLKQYLLPPSQSNALPNTFQTLVCGGLAGSTAALFTTPFDVVKTRLQTEIPGSLRKYNGVFHALKEIAKHEGLKGLYRGLAPRLIMYVSQGAIFFASYEFCKGVFYAEVPQLFAPIIEKKEQIEDESTTPLVPSSAPVSPVHPMPSLR